MNSIKLDVLSGARFRQFVDPFKVQFPDSGMTLIRGINLDTSDTSDAGKSSLILAIQYALGGSPYPGTELQSWFSDEPFKVQLDLSGSPSMSIARGGGLKLMVGDEKIKGGADACESKIDEVFGLDARFRSALTYRRQRKPGMFLDMPNSKIKEFLSKPLQLDRFELAATAATKKAAELVAQTATTTRLLESKKVDLQQWRDAIAAAPTVDLEEVTAIHGSLVATRAALEDGIVELVSRRDELLLDIDRQVKVALKEARVALDSKIVAISARVVQFKLDLAAASRVLVIAQQNSSVAEGAYRSEKTRLERLAATKKPISNQISFSKARYRELALTEEKLKQNKCPTCVREWADGCAGALAEVVTKKDEALRAAKTLADQLAEAEAAEQALMGYPLFVPSVELTAATQKHKAAGDAISAESDLLHRAQADLQGVLDSTEKTKRSKLITSVGQAITAIDVDISARKQKLSQCDSDIARSAQAVTDAKIRAAALKSNLDMEVRVAHEIFLLESELAKTLVTVSAERDFAQLVGRDGFLGAIFDEILEEIEDSTNVILGSIANTRHIVLKIDSENETKSGNIQKVITPRIIVGGRTVPLESGTSGGMFTSVELAADLAVSSVLARRMGVAPGWIILDEAFNGLGRVSKETAMEVLGNHAGDRLVLIVDHSTELQSMFTKIIDVVTEDRRAHIK